MAEAGVPGFEMASWQAAYAPKNLPPPIKQRLSTEITRILQMPDVKDKLTNQLGMEVVAGSPEQLAALMQKEIPRWGELVRKSGATPN
jgi:tripartite-type tricarboxylate transporter receptor subunit TctC